MANLDIELAAFEGMRASLEANHTGEWVLVHDGQLVEHFPSFEAAAQVAISRFGHGPYLIRQVGAPPVVLPASVMYNLVHG